MRRLSFPSLVLAALAAFAPVSPLAGQSREAVRPGRYSGPGQVKARRSELPSARYGLARPYENDLPPVTAEQIAAAPHKGILQAAGLHRKFLPDTAAAGAWVTTAQGPVWRMAVRSAGAQGIRVHFQEFAAGAGKVWVHDGTPDAVEIDRPYTGRGPRGDGDFWTPALFGETAVIEYEPAAGAGEAIPFRVAEISHLFAGLDPQASGAAPAAAACHLDVSCYSQWADSAKAVARMVFETSEGSFLCTGALLMDRNKTYTPYFLTADHCISTDAEARSLTTFWFYQTSSCGGAPPNVRNATQTTGARYLTGGSQEKGDFTLLQLDSVPSGVTFAGWSPDTVPIGAGMTGIHHPTGDYKRISIGKRAEDMPGVFSENAHYAVLWSGGGHTEGGSSGSPVFTEPGVVAGTLTGGFKPPAGKTVCDVNPDVSIYGKFSTYYPALSQYLEGRSVGGTGDGSKTLTPGTPASFSYNVANATLFSGSAAYSLDVPANASSVDIELTTDSPSAQVSVVARFGSAPTVTDGKLVADAAASTSGGRAVLHLDANSTPPLRSGKWYFGLAIFTTGTTVSGKIAATVLIGGVAPPTGGTPVALTSGVTRNLSLNMIGTATFFGGSNGFKIDVPQGATRLDVHANIPNRTYSLLVRYGSEPYPVTGDYVTDFFQGNNSSYDAVVTVTPSSSPALKAGTYYIALLVFSDQPVVPGTITATVQGGGSSPAGAVNLISGVPQNFSLPAVSGNTLFNGNSGFRITVPSGATKLEVKVLTNTPGADIDLYVRSGSDVAVSDSRVVADYTSSGDGGNETITITANSSPALKAGTYYIGLGLFTKGTEVVGTVTATVETSTATPPPGSGPATLIPGVPANFSLPAQENATLFSGAYGFKVTVPAGATKMTIGMAASTSADVRLFVRKGAQPVIENGDLLADWGTAKGASTLTIDASSTPALAAGDYYVAFGVMTACAPVSGTISVSIETPRVTPPDPGGTTLDSGKAREISIDPISSAKLFAGDSGYRIVVPEGAQKLEIRTKTTPATADIDLFVRYGNAPTVSNGSVVADFRSEGPAGEEVITITPQSSPALRAGTYYIGIALFTTNTAVKVTLTATVGSSSGGGDSSGATVLTSGIPQPFSVKAVTGASLIADRYQITVPQGAKKLSIRLVTNTPGVDLDLYARFGQDLDVQDRKVVADFDSSGDTGNELIEITPSSSPALRAGTYYIGMAIFTTGIAASGTLTATVETESSSSATALTSGVGQRFSLPAVTGPTLMSVSGAFRVDVPAGATQLKVMATGSQMDVDFDLYVRYGAPPEVANGQVVADFKSTEQGGDERIVVTPTSTPALRAGTYYLTLLLKTTGKTSTGTITATVETGSAPPAGSTKLTSGLPAKFTLPAVDSPTLFVGDYGFQIDVPQGATRLQIKLNTTTPNVDTDLYVRYGSDVDLTSAGDVIADYDSSGDTGDESIVITSASSKPLQAGTYFIGFGLFTAGVAAEGKITATVESAPALPGGDAGTKLEPGVKTPFSLEPVSQATLFTGGRGFQVTVPNDATKLQIDVATSTAGADVDLFVAYGAMPDVVAGRVTADYRSATSGGNESVAVTRYSTPPLKAGTYYVALAVFTLNTTVEGTVTATLSSTQSMSTELRKGLAADEPEPKPPVAAAVR